MTRSYFYRWVWYMVSWLRFLWTLVQVALNVDSVAEWDCKIFWVVTVTGFPNNINSIYFSNNVNNIFLQINTVAVASQYSCKSRVTMFSAWNLHFHPLPDNEITPVIVIIFKILENIMLSYSDQQLKRSHISSSIVTDLSIYSLITI